MYIIDKNKDFYDFYSKIYGIDRSIVFDRRGSILLDDNMMLIEHSRRYWNSSKESMYFLLEVGYKQYLIEFLDIKKKYNTFSCTDEIVSYEVKLAKVFNENKHLYRKEISLVGISLPYYYSFRKKDRDKDREKLITNVRLNDLDYPKMKHIELPILANTKLTTFLDAKEIWKDLSTFISSKKNDKNVDIVNTDKDKIVIHGFDVKTSFRHPVK